MANNDICTNCGYTGQAKKITKGSTVIELVLWLCLFFPGLLYSVWRLTTRHLACPKCGGTQLIPVDSPKGKKLRQEFAES